ncbi:MAG TPA: DUF4383 domain-containing protein [Egibacteraceae bacterium]|nr:DUF4383 domain-containing protein [Egibacteraceae bacterium]
MASRASDVRSTGTTGKTLNQKVGLVFGAVYILVGLLGFTVSGGNFVGSEGGLLLGIFEVNGLHNIVHLAIGAALIGAALSSAAASRGVNMTIGAVYLALGVLGWFIQDTALDIVALNAADHLLHLASGILLIAVARGVGENRTA